MFSAEDFEAASTKAGKVEAEVKRLHTLIVDINSHKLKAQQDKLDQINTQLDDISSAVTKAQVAIKTAGRSVTTQWGYTIKIRAGIDAFHDLILFWGVYQVE